MTNTKFGCWTEKKKESLWMKTGIQPGNERLNSCINTDVQWEQLKISFKWHRYYFHKRFTSVVRIWTNYLFHLPDCEVMKLSKRQACRKQTSKLIKSVASCFWDQRVKCNIMSQVWKKHYKTEKPEQDNIPWTLPPIITVTSHPLSKPGLDPSHWCFICFVRTTGLDLGINKQSCFLWK